MEIPYHPINVWALPGLTHKLFAHPILYTLMLMLLILSYCNTCVHHRQAPGLQLLVHLVTWTANLLQVLWIWSAVTRSVRLLSRTVPTETSCAASLSHLPPYSWPRLIRYSYSINPSMSEFWKRWKQKAVQNTHYNEITCTVQSL